MHAVSYDAFAPDNSELRYGELPDPKLGPSQVLIEVRAAGVNPVDWKVMAGGLDPMMDTFFPVIPGWDVAGVVTALGPDTPEFAVGDEVMAYARKDDVHAGTFATLVAVDAPAVARKPPGMNWIQAAGLPLAGLTALRTLDRMEVGRGDTLLVYGASGGVGGMAVQLGADRGARVIGTASKANQEYVRGLGAEPVVYGDGLAERVRELAPDGVTAVADFVGGQVDVTKAVLAPGGRNASVVDPEVAKIGGLMIWVRPDGAKLTELAEIASRGALRVVVERTFPLSAAGEAFDVSRAGHVRGKLVLEV
ncbi:NADP-dependent oxidoreductase [Streptomyces polyrhachis]|uniref:NADP-dependent oxidoreductase n=1 Tax=Streptomyces polyrhachis TaxID=1282885 RepID=A0ABW2GLE2_9ACTN